MKKAPESSTSFLDHLLDDPFGPTVYIGAQDLHAPESYKGRSRHNIQHGKSEEEERTQP